MIIFIIKLVAGILLLTLLFGVLRNWQMERSPSQKIFESGKVPDPLPDGLYQGSVPGHQVSWLGKKFNQASSTGINVFQNGTTTTEEYPFLTLVGSGVRDIAKQVFKIDYNIHSNPFWLRFILDEIVETEPGHYLGKLHLTIVPEYPFTLGFFELKK